jgi:hypothetical protein
MARVNRDLSRTVLVDDTPLAFLHQPNNGIPVLGFRGDPDDRLLLEAVLPLLQVSGQVELMGDHSMPCQLLCPASSPSNVRSFAPLLQQQQQQHVSVLTSNADLFTLLSTYICRSLPASRM